MLWKGGTGYARHIEKQQGDADAGETNTSTYSIISDQTYFTERIGHPNQKGRLMRFLKCQSL